MWRLVGAILLTVLLSSFTPTKWTIQFGMYAGLAAAMTAVATVAVAQSARRSQRNLAIYIAVLLFACAIAVAGSNAWGWAYDFGISGFDKTPSLGGAELSSVFLALTVVALGAATWFISGSMSMSNAAGDRPSRRRCCGHRPRSRRRRCWSSHYWLFLSS